jgi:hypothetical protein
VQTFVIYLLNVSPKTLKNMKRRELIEELEELLSDEFDSSELVYLTKKELIRILISTAKFYKYEQD